MRSISDVLQNSGGKVVYNTKTGKQINLDYLTLKHMSEYENRLQNRSMKQLTEQRANMPSDIFAKLFSELMDKIASGNMAFGSEVCQKSLSTIQGVTDLISILTGLTPEESLELITTEGEAFKIIFDEVIRKSIGSKDDEVVDGEDVKKN